MTTTGAGKTAPLGGFGVYMQTSGTAQYKLNDITINTSGADADGIRSNSEAVFFKADRLTIATTGSSADGINLASNSSSNYDGLIYVTGYANIDARQGVAVRANNFRSADANSVIILPGGSTIRVSGTGTASNASESTGYAVYAGNRNSDTNGLSTSDILQGKNNKTLGSSYVFIGSDATIATATRNGHAVYANKGGLIQLGDGVSVTTTGTGAYALYAATEQQGSYTDNVRPGFIFLEGGATLRAANNQTVIMANGAGSIIASQAMDVPVIPDSFIRTNRVQGLDKSLTHETSGVFDIVGNMEAINGGTIALNMADGSRFTGATNVHSEAVKASSIDLTIDGAASRWLINANSTLSSLKLGSGAVLQPYRIADEATSFSLTGDVANAGLINLADAAMGDVFTVRGNYAANNGALALNTSINAGGALADQRTDRLLVNGDVSGVTTVTVSAAADSAGGPTSVNGNSPASQGISLIQVSGTAAQDSFQLLGGYTTLAGQPYQYTLYAYGPGSSLGEADAGQRLVDGSGLFWDYRLQSVYVPSPMPITPDPKQPTDPDEHNQSSNRFGLSPSQAPPVQVRAVVPQVASYLVAPTALFQAGMMDISTLHRRFGEIRGDVPSARDGATGNFFIRSYGGRYNYTSNLNAYQYGYDANIDYAGVQMGGDIYALEGANSTMRIGVAGSVGSLSFEPRNVYAANSTRLTTWAVSAYATYLQDNGWYVDGIVSYGGFNGSVSTDLRGRTASLSGERFAASIETGYPFKLGDGFVIEPQAQLVYQRLMFDRKTDIDRFAVALGTQDQLIGRAGVRISKSFGLEKADRQITLYATANLLHGFGGGGAVFVGDTFRLGKFGTAVEGGLGVNAKLSKNLSLFAEAAYQQKIGKAGISGFTVNGNLRYTF